MVDIQRKVEYGNSKNNKFSVYSRVDNMDDGNVYAQPLLATPGS